MEDIIKCLEGVIGISDTECVCYSDGKEERYTKSLSGYYMDHPDYGIPMSYPQTVYDCEANNAWDLCDKMRRDGIVSFVTDFQRHLSGNKHVRSVTPWRGKLGDYRGTELVTPVSTIHGIVIDPLRWASMTAEIASVVLYTGLSDGSSVEVNVFEEYKLRKGDEVPSGVFTGTVNANGIAELTGTAVRLPLQDPDGYPSKIYVVSGGSYEPKDTKLYYSQTKRGGCCGKVAHAVTEPWGHWVDVDGILGSDLTPGGLLSGSTSGNKSYGLSVSLSMSCDTSFWCHVADWTGNTWARVCAELIMLYSQKMLIGYMLSTDVANIYTSARSEEMIEKLGRIEEAIAERMSWASDQFPEGTSSCYTCQGISRKRSILV